MFFKQSWRYIRVRPSASFQLPTQDFPDSGFDFESRSPFQVSGSSGEVWAEAAGGRPCEACLPQRPRGSAPKLSRRSTTNDATDRVCTTTASRRSDLESGRTSSGGVAVEAVAVEVVVGVEEEEDVVSFRSSVWSPRTWCWSRLEGWSRFRKIYRLLEATEGILRLKSLTRCGGRSLGWVGSSSSRTGGGRVALSAGREGLAGRRRDGSQVRSAGSEDPSGLRGRVGGSRNFPCSVKKRMLYLFRPENSRLKTYKTINISLPLSDNWGILFFKPLFKHLY